MRTEYADDRDDGHALETYQTVLNIQRLHLQILLHRVRCHCGATATKIAGGTADEIRGVCAAC